MQQRRLVLVRHATAAEGSVDADRPLTSPGARNAAAIGTWLAQAGLVPDRVVVSPARRAEQTWEQAGGALASAPRPVVDRRIYDNTVEALLAVIRETPDPVRTLVLVGHNPAVGELSGTLDDGRGEPVARRAMEAGFPAGAVAVFDPAGSFSSIAEGTAALVDFAVPRA